MAATSCSGASATQYDVFLSFRGPDTRNTFTDCLYQTMFDQGIVAYKDSEDLHAGDRIDDLLKAVGASKICIPVLSRGYPSSAWCLRELDRAMELNKSTGKPEILPIFFDVTPSDVKLMKEVYGEDLKKHEGRHGREIKQRWEEALSKVGEIKGWEVQGKSYSEVINLVVKEVLRKVKAIERPLGSVLVGVDEQVEAIMKLLDIDSGAGACFVGLYGMGGIGKTTLATIVFNKLCYRFDGQCSFIGNIRESSNKSGLVYLQKKFASDISGPRFVENFIDADEGIDSIRRRASSKKVLLVLDDLDKREQFQKLVGGADTFVFGSIIIITTRDKRVLDEEEGILAYEVKQIKPDEALELFCLHAFKSASPPDTHQSLSQEVVSTTGGLPLALEVIGSSLRGKGMKIWEEMLERLKKVLHNEVRDKLKISYDALGEEEKEIFLDIACFFRDDKISRATYFWDACDLSPHISLEELTDLCLIKIVDGDDIWMHDQVRDLGRDIVRQECIRSPIGRSRLWNTEEALKVVRSKERKDKVQALNLIKHHLGPISIRGEELERMPNLKFLELSTGTFVGDINNYLLELRWLSWAYPPLDNRMTNLHLKNVVVFELSDNENTENWGGWNILKMANKLKVLSLSRCSGLKRTPDFSGCLSLERLSLCECSNLQEVDHSIGKLKDLTHLDIISCESLQNLPEEIGRLVNLKHFSIQNCHEMEKLPHSIGKLKGLTHLDIIGCKNLQNLPEEIEELVNLKHFSIAGCDEMAKLIYSIKELASWSKPKISSTKIARLPDSIGNAKHLSSLDLSYTSIVKLPISIGKLTKLTFLSLEYCRNLRELPESIGNLTTLQHFDISGTNIVELPDSIKNLRQLKVIRMGETPIRSLPVGIGMLERLEELDARDCEQLEGELPTEIGRLSSLSILNISDTHVCAVPTAINSLMQLKKLDLMDCNDLQELPKLPSSLNYLCVRSTSLQLVPDFGNLVNLVELHLSNGFGQALGQASNPMQALQLQWVGKLTKLETLKWGLSDVPVPLTALGCLPRLRELTFSCMDSFDSVVVGPQFSNLKYLSKLCLYGSTLRKIELNELELLKSLEVRNCEFVEGLSIISSSLRKLSRMEVLDCPNLLEIRFLSTMESLNRLHVYRCNSLGRLCGLSNSKKLEFLQFMTCDGLQVVEGLEELELLHRLYVYGCGSLEWLTDESNSKIPNECFIYVLGCAKLPNAFDMRYGNYKKKFQHQTRRTFKEISLSTMESLQSLLVVHCNSLGRLCGLSNSKKLDLLHFVVCNWLRVVEGLEELEPLSHLIFQGCGSLEWLIDESNSKIPNECSILVVDCAKSPDSGGGYMRYENYKKMIHY